MGLISAKAVTFRSFGWRLVVAGGRFKTLFWSLSGFYENSGRFSMAVRLVKPSGAD